MDLLAGAHTRLYLSHISVLGAIELLTSLLDQWLQGLGELVVEVEDTNGTLGINDSVISYQELMGGGGGGNRSASHPLSLVNFCTLCYRDALLMLASEPPPLQNQFLYRHLMMWMLFGLSL